MTNNDKALIEMATREVRDCLVGKTLSYEAALALITAVVSMVLAVTPPMDL